jgi:formate--tetrahydrofolate ligase
VQLGGGHRLALKLGDICLTEAGFATDLGAEKFFDIKCRLAGLRPDAAMIVATCRALKYHGGVPVKDLEPENPDALRRGLANLDAHVDIIRQFKVPAIVGLNRYPSDTEREYQLVAEHCAKLGSACTWPTSSLGAGTAAGIWPRGSASSSPPSARSSRRSTRWISR